MPNPFKEVPIPFKAAFRKVKVISVPVQDRGAILSTSEEIENANAQHSGAGEAPPRTLEEIREENARNADAIVRYILKTTPADPTEGGYAWQHAKAFHTDGSGRSYALLLINYTGVKEFKPENDPRRLIIVLSPQESGAEGYDMQERTSDHTLLDLNESRLRHGLYTFEPYPGKDKDTPPSKREYERASKYGEILTDIVKSLGINIAKPS